MTKEEVWRSIAQVRWLQVKELKHKYPNDQEFGSKVRELVNKTPSNNKNYYNENNKENTIVGNYI